VFVALALLFGASTACQGPDDPDHPSRTGRAEALFYDPGRVQKTTADPLLVIGADPELPLDRVEGAILHGDRVAVANAGSNEVLVFDAQGELIAREGRTGDGPGDYRYLAGIHRHDRGLIAWDAFHYRVSLLDSEGVFLQSIRVPQVGGAARAVGAFGDNVLVTSAEPGFPGEGVVDPVRVRPPVEYAIVRLTDGALIQSGSLPGQELWAQRKGTGSTHGGLPVIFGRDAVAAVTPSRAYLATTDSLVLTAVGSTGDRAVFRLPQPRTAATPAWTTLVRDSTRAHIEAMQPGRIVLDDGRNLMGMLGDSRLEQVEELPVRASLPSFSDIKGGADGRLWIREYPTPEQSEVTWVALDDQGSPAQWVVVPVSLDVVDLSEDRILVLARGDYEEDLLEVYGIR